MKAFLIDPFAKVVTEVDYNGDYHQIYDFIKADLFDAVRANKYDDTLFVDDEGLFKDDQAFFKWKTYGQPLAGRAVLLGTDNDGEPQDVQATLDEVVENILWQADYVNY
jgi:hypothetical protein